MISLPFKDNSWRLIYGLFSYQIGFQLQRSTRCKIAMVTNIACHFMPHFSFDTALMYNKYIFVNFPAILTAFLVEIKSNLQSRTIILGTFDTSEDGTPSPVQCCTNCWLSGQKIAHFLVFSTLQRGKGEKSARCPKIIDRPCITLKRHVKCHVIIGTDLKMSLSF